MERRIMRITQGTFSYLPDFTEDQIKAQVRYCFENGWAFSIEHTDDPHPRNSYWEMWGLPMFELQELNEAMERIDEGRQTTMLSFIVQRPEKEPGFYLERAEAQDRRIQYTIRSRSQSAN